MRQEDIKNNDDFIVSQIGRPVELSSMKSPKRKTAATLGMISCLILCLGLEMATTRPVWSVVDTASPHLNKPVLIIPRNAPGKDSYAEVQPESFESYQIRILRNQNHLQAEKLKLMRQELAEVTHKLHELTPHLFKQGDPADREKIAELSLRLIEKEQEIDRLIENKSQIESELALTKKASSDAETIKEALTAMVDKQRAIKEQNALNFKKEIEELYAFAAAEKNNLLGIIQQNEALHEKLNREIAEKTQSIMRLDAIATQQDAMLSLKDDRLHSLDKQVLSLYADLLATSDAYLAHQAATDGQVHALIAGLEWEHAQAEKLQEFKNEMEWIADLYEGTKTLLTKDIDNLTIELREQKWMNGELSLAKAELDARRLELALLLATHADYKTEMDASIQNLGVAIASEQVRAEQLEHQLQVLLNHQEAGERYTEQLETHLQDMGSLLAAKQAEIDVAGAEHADIVGGLLLHLDSSEMAADFHKTSGDKLSETLAETNERYRGKEEELEKKLGENLLENKNNKEAWQQQLTRARDEHKLNEEGLQQALDEALLHYQIAEATGSQLQALLEEINLKSVALEEELMTRKHALAQKEAQLIELEENHEAAKNKINDHFTHHIHQLENEIARSYQLEMMLEGSSQLASLQENELSDYKNKLLEKEGYLQALQDAHSIYRNDLNKQMAQLNAAIEEEKQRTQSLNEDLERLTGKYNEQLSLHQNVLSTQQQDQEHARTLNEKIQALNANYENERKRSADLERHIQELSQELYTKDQHLSHHQNAAEANLKLLQQISQLEENYLREKDHSQLHEHYADQLQHELLQAQASLELLAQKEAERLAKGGEDQLQNDKLCSLLTKLQADLEAEKAFNSSLKSDLNYARMNYVQEQSSRRNLEQILQDTQSKIVQLEKNISCHQAAVANAEKALAQSQNSQQHLLWLTHELETQMDELKRLNSEQASR